MASASSRKSSASVRRYIPPSGRYSHSPTQSSAFASYASSFPSRSSTFFNRSTSPTRVSLFAPAPPSPSVRFSLDRPISPNRSISVSPRAGSSNHHHHQIVRQTTGNQKRTCMCSPTTHPGSFRCSLHKSLGSNPVVAYSTNRLNARRSAMTNSLVRIGGVEGDLVKRALTALIRPSSHQQRRRAGYQSRPSRLCIMSRADD